MNSSAKEELAKQELAKAFVLASEGVKVKMFSRYIDKVWHEMANDPAKYEKFSLDACGHIIAHAETSGSGVVDFVDVYERRFGKMPDVWFMDENGKLNSTLLDTHMKGQPLSVGWDCTPTHNCLAPEDDD